MLAEDAADRYLIMERENRTANRPVIILARSFLNPGRAFANLMAFRPLWIRETRLKWHPAALPHAQCMVNRDRIAVGAAFDVVVTRPFAWRVLNLEYAHSWMNDVAQIHPQGLKISTQAVVRIGTW